MLVDDRARPRRGRGGNLRALGGPRVLGSLGVLGLMAAAFGVLLLGSPAVALPVEPPPQIPTPTVTESIPAPTVTVTQRPPTVTATEAPPTVTETALAPTVTITATATVRESPVATAEPNPTTTVRVTMTEAPPTTKKPTPSATASPDEPERTVPAGATSPAPPGPHAGASALAGAAVALVAVGGVYAGCRAVVYLR